MSEIRLVVTDLDGTFWHGQEVIHPEIRAAVDELRRRDITFMIATGRRLQSVRRGMAPAGIAAPAVLMSGSLGVDLDSGTQWHRAGFEADLATEVLARFRAHEVEPLVYLGHGPGRDAVAREDCASSPQHIESFGSALLRGNPEDHMDGDATIGFGLISSTHPKLGTVAKDLADIANVWHSIDDTYGGWTLMVGPPDVTKLTALAPWCERHGYLAEEVLAVGDGTNDFAMLDWAGTAVAVENRPTADRPHDAIIPAPQQAGWTQLLDLV